jgi:Tfp pilus assembly protein PilV
MDLSDMPINIKDVHRNKGQSLIEAVVAIGVVILIVSGLIVAVISSIRSAQSSRSRSVATKLTQDGMESMRNLRDSGWTQFISLASGVEWCLGSDGIITAPDETDLSCPQIESAKTFFDRRIVISDTSDEQATVMVTVTWTEGSTPRRSSAVTYLTKWR